MIEHHLTLAEPLTCILVYLLITGIIETLRDTVHLFKWLYKKVKK